MNTTHRHHTPPASRRGFTLLELVISVALVLVLMLAITKIFSITSTTIGASQGISAAVRDARAAQAVFARDLGAMAPDSPFVWIRSDAPIPAFRNATDEAGDLDHNQLTIDLDGNGTEGDATVRGEQIPTFAVNSRNHRLDHFSFCGRDRFTRQTGNSSNLTPASRDVTVSGLSSAEAWIEYGPLALPTKTAAYADPGAGASLSDNPNNYYANQWILGRMAALMINPPTGGDITEGTTIQQYYQRTNGMTPFSSATPSKNVTAATTLQTARYDLIGVDIAEAKTVINATAAWHTQLASLNFRVNPYIFKPINAATASQQVPIFVNSASQFIVEYAGDFLEQNAAGQIIDVNANGTAFEPDGDIDFVVVNGVRQVRWYGYPRDVNNNGILSVADGDVLPLSDVITTATGTPFPAGTAYTNATNPYKRFEHFVNTAGAALGTYTAANTYAAAPAYATYYAAFGPDSINNPQNPRPRMYRITMTIDRPEMAGRTADGQTFEYVFNAP